MNSDKPLPNIKSTPEIPPSKDSPAHGPLRRFFVKLCEVVGCHVPLGYEDESGFHFGAQPSYVLQEALTETGTQTSAAGQPSQTVPAPGRDSSRPPWRLFLS